MDTRRIRAAELLALVAGTALLVDLFLPWYSFAAGRHNAWESLTAAPVLLLLSALLAIGLFGVTLTGSSPALPVAFGVWLVPVSLISTLVLLVRVLDPPGGSTGRCYGAIAGLACAALILIAAWMSIGDERPARGISVRHAEPAA